MKTKTLISFAISAKLVCSVFAHMQIVGFLMQALVTVEQLCTCAYVRAFVPHNEKVHHKACVHCKFFKSYIHGTCPHYKETYISDPRGSLRKHVHAIYRDFFKVVKMKIFKRNVLILFYFLLKT